NYNTFRWITTGGAFAMGPSRANPLTGEILDADIIFDADMIRYWKLEAKMFGQNRLSPEETPTMIGAIRHGWGLPRLPVRQGSLNWDMRKEGTGDREQGTAREDPRARLWAARQGVCQCGPCMRYELGLVSLALAAVKEGKSGGDAVPEELIGQAIKM